jgi:tetratricopeptide (TPR) repeat protein
MNIVSITFYGMLVATISTAPFSVRENLLTQLGACSSRSDADAEIRMAACTAIIQSPGTPHETLVIAYFNRAVAFYYGKDYENSIADLNQAILLDTDFPEAYYNRGNAWAAKSQYDNAISDYSNAVNLKPDYYEALDNRGRSWHKKGDDDRALADYDAAIKINPDDELIYVNRGLVWLKRHDFDRAVADFDDALRLNPKDSIAFVNRASAWHHKGDEARSIADLDRAIEIKPNDAIAYFNRALSWRAMRNDDLAIPDLDQAVKLKPDFADAYELRGFLRYRRSQYQLAIDDSDVALRIMPDDIAALNNRCWYRAVMNDSLDEALADCNRAIELRPNSSIHFGSRSFLHFRRAEFSSAVSDADAALALDSKNADALFIRGIAKRRLGQQPEGDSDIKAAQEIDSSVATKYDQWGVKP